MSELHDKMARVCFDHLIMGERMRLKWLSWFDKEGSIQHQISIWSPCPLPPLFFFKSVISLCHLLICMLWIEIWGRPVSVPLADYGRMCATPHCVHVPVSIIVVHYVEKTPSAPRHSLNQSLPEMVERYCHLHYCILGRVVVCTKQHHLEDTDKQFTAL